MGGELALKLGRGLALGHQIDAGLGGFRGVRRHFDLHVLVDRSTLQRVDPLLLAFAGGHELDELHGGLLLLGVLVHAQAEVHTSGRAGSLVSHLREFHHA